MHRARAIYLASFLFSRCDRLQHLVETYVVTAKGPSDFTTSSRRITQGKRTPRRAYRVPFAFTISSRFFFHTHVAPLSAPAYKFVAASQCALTLVCACA